MLSITIPVWNQTREASDMTKRNVERLWDVATVPLEIILVDNASRFTDQYPASVWLTKRTNEGIAPAFNTGMALAHGETLAFLNTDVEVTPGWDTALVTAAHAVDGVTFPWTDEGAGPAKNDGIGVAGWCFVVPTETARRVGRFDETFVPAFWEDTDWFHRAVKLGIPLYSVPGAVVKHQRRTSARHLAGMDLLFTANRLRFAWKHGLHPGEPPEFWRTPLPEYPTERTNA